MKNKYIDEKLKDYVESVKPDKELISGAFSALKNKPMKGAEVRFNFNWVARFLAASFVFIVVLSTMMFENKVEYRLSELNYQTKSNMEIESQSNILMLKSEETDASYRMYYSEDEANPMVITSFYKVVGLGGLDEILVVTDLKNGLTDFSDFKNYKKYTTIHGIPILKMEMYENGEYYINIYFEYENVYYIKIASSTEISAEIYIRKLLKN